MTDHSPDSVFFTNLDLANVGNRNSRPAVYHSVTTLDKEANAPYNDLPLAKKTRNPVTFRSQSSMITAKTDLDHQYETAAPYKNQEDENIQQMDSKMQMA